jgi:predicted dehydrogenase
MTEFYNKPIIVFGAGSIGERHIRNLWLLGFKNIFVFRQRNLPFREIADAKVIIIKTWDEVQQIKAFAAIITSPTSLHVSQAQKCAELGLHVLIEKPLSSEIESLNQFESIVKKYNIFVYVGYMNRFHPLILKIKEIIKQKTFGSLISIQSKWAEYLPDWHPWEDYRESYAARKELGGGVALTLSHDIDMVLFLVADEIHKYHVIKNHKSSLETNVEAGADFLMLFKNRTTANIHLNFYEKVKERFLKLVFDDASIQFDFFSSKLTIKTTQGEISEILENFDRNDLFIEQSKYFFNKIQSGFEIEESINQIKDSKLIITMCNDEQ